MNLCNYYDRLEKENGELVRIVNAVPRAKDKQDLSLDVYKEYESGICECRNLYTSMCGYRVAFPDEVTSLYHNGTCLFIQKLDDFEKTKKIAAFQFYSQPLDEKSKCFILSKYPDFKYVLNKWSGSIAKTMNVLSIWKDHKEIELLLAVGYERLALNKSFWKLSEKNKKEIVLFVRKNQSMNKLSLTDIQIILKNRLNMQEYMEFDSFCYKYGKIRYDFYVYLKKINRADYVGFSLYRDYWKLLKQTNHNLKDDYWCYPKDLETSHNKILQEVESINSMKQLDKLKLKQDKYFKAVKKLLKYKTEIDGYYIFIPESVEEISKHAEKLHQCLIANDYVQQVIDKNCVLVFIQKSNIPIATCQLLKDDKIGQFYADELDRSNCLPSAEVKTAMNKWIEYKRSFA